MKWGGNDLPPDSDEILDKNLSKIADPKINTVLVVFPYNQKDLFVPDNEDWFRILQNQKMENTCLIVSPNSLVKAKPLISDNRLIITSHEMILNYWKEIRYYVETNPNIKNMEIVAPDLDIERIRRDYQIVFSDFKLKFKKTQIVEIISLDTPSSFWKKVYSLREKLVLALPIWFYKRLGGSR